MMVVRWRTRSSQTITQTEHDLHASSIKRGQRTNNSPKHRPLILCRLLYRIVCAGRASLTPLQRLRQEERADGAVPHAAAWRLLTAAQA